MSELQTYKWANWVDVKDSDELVIYDTSKPTYIREGGDKTIPVTWIEFTVTTEDGWFSKTIQVGISENIENTPLEEPLE